MTIPPYNPLVPLPDDTIADGQQAFLTNFATISTAFNTNHISLTDLNNAGKHHVIQLTEQKVPRSTESQEIAIYSKKVANQTEQIFMRYPLNGKEFQLTEYQVYPSRHIANRQAAFFTTLPGGIIVYFGSVFPNTPDFRIDLDPAICTNIMGVNLCPIAPWTNYQSNVNVIAENGKFVAVVLNTRPASGTGSAIPPNQYYLIFGNI